MKKSIATNLQYAISNDEKNDYIQYMKNECDVDILFDRPGDFCDELSIEGEFLNVQRAIYIYYYDDESQIEHNAPEFLYS